MSKLLIWYHFSNGQQHGPLSLDAIELMIHSQELASNTLIWREGMADWKPLAQTPEFSQLAAQVTLNLSKRTGGTQPPLPRVSIRAGRSFDVHNMDVGEDPQANTLEMVREAQRAEFKEMEKRMSAGRAKESPISKVLFHNFEATLFFFSLVGGLIFYFTVPGKWHFMFMVIGSIWYYGASLAIVVRAWGHQKLYGVLCFILPLFAIGYALATWRKNGIALALFFLSIPVLLLPVFTVFFTSSKTFPGEAPPIGKVVEVAKREIGQFFDEKF